MRVSPPEQHAPPVYGCAAGAVLHAHAGDSLEPAVLLHTYLPPGVEDALRQAEPVVDVSGDGTAASTLTVRVLAGADALSWQLPIAPFVAGLPGQPGDEGRMVLLAVLDGEPPPGFWSKAVDCESVAAELQLPVADLVEALRGRLTPWLAEDLEVLLHDDAHDRAADRSPAQTVASAVLSHYRADLAAEKQTAPLLRALALAPPAFAVEVGARLSAGLAAAIDDAGPRTVAAVLEQAGPFEAEVIRLLTGLPALISGAPAGGVTEATMAFLLDGPDKDESVRAAVSVIARLARESIGPGLPDAQVLRHLGMVDDAALGRLASLWVGLAAAADGHTGEDASRADALAALVVAEGRPGLDWLRETARAISDRATAAAGRGTGRVAETLRTLRGFLDEDVTDVAEALTACFALARFVRTQGRVGPGGWLTLPSIIAARAVGLAYVGGLGRDVAADLLSEVLEEDVAGLDLLDALVCATAQVLAHLDPHDGDPTRQGHVSDLLAALPADGSKSARWLLVACLREAPDHDPTAADLRPALLGEPVLDPERAATRAGRRGMLDGGLLCLDALAAGLGEVVAMSREDILAAVFPSALGEHGLLRDQEDALIED